MAFSGKIFKQQKDRAGWTHGLPSVPPSIGGDGGTAKISTESYYCRCDGDHKKEEVRQVGSARGVSINANRAPSGSVRI